ncbi:MAG: cytidine deaminase [Bacteroidales bacterium]|jgi:cytidine deaminase|nr:cytidine deaminase [Bacteroidales bacterium]
MKKEIFQLEMHRYDAENELSHSELELLDKAKQAAKNAYAPYSRFRVGAAVLLSNGVIVIGNNQENAAYPSGLCAERVALFHANAVYPDAAVEAIAITAISDKSVIDEPIAPCGACRQVMAEYEKKSKGDMKVIMQGQQGPVLIAPSMRSLLPFSFLGDFLLKYE